MTASAPIDVLLQEHRLIRLVLADLSRQAEAIVDSGGYDRQQLNRLVDFLKLFVDRFHHQREEAILFQTLRRHGLAEDLLQQLEREHEKGRRLARQLAAALLASEQGEDLATPKVEEALRDYIELLTGHLRREEELLFPQLAQLSADGELAGLADELRREEDWLDASPSLTRLRQWAEELAETD